MSPPIQKIDINKASQQKMVDSAMMLVCDSNPPATLRSNGRMDNETWVGVVYDFTNNSGNMWEPFWDRKCLRAEYTPKLQLERSSSFR